MKKIIPFSITFLSTLLAFGQSSGQERAVYHASEPRTTDVVHTELKVEFDWDNAHLLGEAVLTLKPYFYALDTFELDAQGMEIKTVAYVSQGRNTSLKYSYDGMTLKIAAGRTVSRDETMKIRIDYIAKPNELEVEGGSAISEAKGLYFINPKNDERGWMRQVWTQGEPASNSAWFPTVDEPNERMTHEIAITVPKSYTTISNGRLDFKTNNANGTRTDFWLMDQPHAPYLVMMAVGEFASQSEEWNDIPVNYFVEPEYENVAADVYPYTTEMLQFFSDRLGVTYPWQKYDQVTVREYVSGAMENTTGVIFGDFVYGDALSWEDGNNEAIVAHEMFHHWFGDLVTCESWANLPLNESFATYGEVLWFEHKYGQDEGDWHAYNDLRGYMAEYNRGKSVDVIRYDYESVLGMFDGHSYAKGGRILKMLRHILGDDAFFEGLRVYLEDNAYQSVEIHNLRLAFEKVSGLDLNWFFNQWFLAKGHPVLNIEHTFNRDSGQYIVKVTQSQDLSEVPLYRLPVAIDVYTSLGTKRYEVEVTEQEQEFVFDVMSKPFLVLFDADQYLLADIRDEKPTDFLLHQFAHGPLMMDRYEAITGIVDGDAKGVKKGMILRLGMQDKFHAIRRYALSKVKDLPEAELAMVKQAVEKLLSDENAAVRALAHTTWWEVFGEGDANFYTEVMMNESSYAVKSAAFEAWTEINPNGAGAYAKAHMTERQFDFQSTLIEYVFTHPELISSSQVNSFVRDAGADLQNTIHLYLPSYLMRVNETDRAGVMPTVREVWTYHEQAKGYFNYGIRFAKYHNQMDSRKEGANTAEIERWNSVLEELSATAG